MDILSILNQKKQYTHHAMPETEFPYDTAYFKAVSNRSAYSMQLLINKFLIFMIYG